jgi:hypothetical protein
VVTAASLASTTTLTPIRCRRTSRPSAHNSTHSGTDLPQLDGTDRLRPEISHYDGLGVMSRQGSRPPRGFCADHRTAAHDRTYSELRIRRPDPRSEIAIQLNGFRASRPNFFLTSPRTEPRRARLPSLSRRAPQGDRLRRHGGSEGGNLKSCSWCRPCERTGEGIAILPYTLRATRDAEFCVARFRLESFRPAPISRCRSLPCVRPFVFS